MMIKRIEGQQRANGLIADDEAKSKKKGTRII